MGNLFQQTFNLGYILFGTRFIEAGLTKNDKSINDRLKIYRAWGKNILEERSREIKKKMEEGELSDEPADLI